METVRRLEANQPQVDKGCLPDSPIKLYSRPTEGSTVHQQLGPKGWVLANPTESRQQAVHGVYSAGERRIPVESDVIRTSFGVCDL